MILIIRFVLNRDGFFIVWPYSAPEWAWKVAGHAGFTIASYGGYENALAWEF